MSTKPKPHPKDAIPIAEVARRIDRSEATIRRWIAGGDFPGYRIGSAYVIPIAWYQSWLKGEWSPQQKDEGVAA